jgi:hypothetical protein
MPPQLHTPTTPSLQASKLSSQNVPPWNLHINTHHSQHPEQLPPHSHPPKAPPRARTKASRPVTSSPNQRTSLDLVVKKAAEQTEEGPAARTAMAPMKSPQKENIELVHPYPLNRKSHPPSMARGPTAANIASRGNCASLILWAIWLPRRARGDYSLRGRAGRIRTARVMIRCWGQLRGRRPGVVGGLSRLLVYWMVGRAVCSIHLRSMSNWRLSAGMRFCLWMT